MNQFKRVQVVMLPTNDINSDLELHIKRNKLYSKQLHNTNYEYNKTISIITWNKQHLYIISDDEIKEGDWYLYWFMGQQPNEGKIQQCINSSLAKCNRAKIIATTDTSLKVKKESFIQGFEQLHKYIKINNLPQPPQQFIENYIESYNKGDVITDILIEYSYKGEQYNENSTLNTNHPKVNPKDNTITIKKLKDSWNEEEVFKLMDDYQDYLFKTNEIVKTFKEWYNTTYKY